MHLLTGQGVKVKTTDQGVTKAGKGAIKVGQN